MPLCYLQYFQENFPNYIANPLSYFYELLLASKLNLWEVNLKTGEVIDFGYSESLAVRIGFQPETTQDLHQKRLSRQEYFIERLHPDDRAIVEDKLRRAYLGEDYEVEYRIKFANSQGYEWILAKGHCITNAKGVRTRLMGTWQNITHSKTQNQIIYNQQRALERISRVYSMVELATTISHDLSQPLFAAHLQLGECQRLLNLPSQDQALQLLTKAREQLDRATTIIQQVKGLITENELKIEKVSLPVLISETIQVNNHLNISPVKVQILTKNKLPDIYVDPSQLSQVFFILFNNSVEASSDIEKLCITITLEHQHDRLTIAYQDNGLGIAKEIQASIFTPFFSSKENSMGIGLVICRRILEALGGSITLFESDNTGANFYIELPVTKDK